MKYEEILKLLDAGYTREEILSMKVAPDEPKPDEPKSDEPKPDMSDVMKEMRDMFSEMKKELTAFNIMNSQQPADNARTSEEIIANIISPVNKKKGDK